VSLPPFPPPQIRYWGVCNETPYGVAELVKAADKLGVPRPVTIQNQFNLLHRSYETSLAELVSPSHYNLALLPWSPLGQGVLTGKYLNGAKPEGSRLAVFSNPMYNKYLEDKASVSPGGLWGFFSLSSSSCSFCLSFFKGGACSCFGHLRSFCLSFFKGPTPEGPRLAVFSDTLYNKFLDGRTSLVSGSPDDRSCYFTKEPCEFRLWEGGNALTTVWSWTECNKLSERYDHEDSSLPASVFSSRRTKIDCVSVTT
jgi:hypothetical protein